MNLSVDEIGERYWEVLITALNHAIVTTVATPTTVSSANRDFFHN